MDKRSVEESILERRLEWFRDLKFGMMIHWGPYSQQRYIQFDASWPLSEEDTWARPNWQGDINEFRKEYWALNKTFNPTQFNPRQWAQLAVQAGMKYLIFTTKHLDGFNMYDTNLSDYKITGVDCPYHTNPYSDITASLFDAFRTEELAIGIYYSKADWHSPYYWIPDQLAHNRYPNYDTIKYPEIWQKFVDFVHGQIKELMTRYGSIDILWLDAGWIRPPSFELNMDRLVRIARQFQPDLIVVDRTVGGRYENYLTPEGEVPSDPLLEKPWETCMPIGNQWSYNPRDKYKSIAQLIHLLVDVVAKGGNLLLNIGPKPDGQFPSEAINRLLEIGKWIRINGEAIYKTRPYPPFRKSEWAYTHRGNVVYAIYLLEDDKETLPSPLIIPYINVASKSQIYLLGVEEPMSWQQDEKGIRINIPKSIAMRPPARYACTFRIETDKSGR